MLDTSRVVCVVPIVLRTGRIPVYLAVNGIFKHVGIFTLGKLYQVTVLASDLVTRAPYSFLWRQSIVKTLDSDLRIYCYF